jgi:glucosamine--fructose-6-phosphate aminotransferase (isomerizing)
MCGIVGMLGSEDVAPRILDGLKRLEYRGYDSAGIATLHRGRMLRRRTVGKLSVLVDSVAKDPIPGSAGIGHIRWATHGAPIERNAHPHASPKAAIVHNGIIENFQALKRELKAAGHSFESETDSEAIVHLITDELAKGNDPIAAFEAAVRRLEGAFAIAALVEGEEDLLLGARRGSPLAFSLENGLAVLGSDSMALAPFVSTVTYLEEGDLVAMHRAGFEVRDETGAVAHRTSRQIQASSALVDKGEHRHYMAKEIHEQTEVIARTLSGLVDPATERLRPLGVPVEWGRLSSLAISACGTAYLAGLVGKYWIEEFARLPVEVDIASEFRYREPPMPDGGAAFFISQSGETADTLAALRMCRARKQTTVAIVNVKESTIAREADAIIPTEAGSEIGVASTKAFTAQMTVLACVALTAAKARGHLSPDAEAKAVHSLIEIPRLVSIALQNERAIAALAHELAKATDTLFIARGRLYPLALEGALKLKEVSYIHAEGYAAGELKHGPIALVDEEMPIVALAPSGPLFEKVASNVREVIARGGRVVLLSDAEGIAALGPEVWQTIELPETNALSAPLVYAIPLQLLAYHTAVAKGTDVDQPRNLAKSVTVE